MCIPRCSNGNLAKMQAKRLAQVGLGAFTWDFWTWFTSGNCATVLQAMPNFTNTWSAFPNLGYKCVTCPDPVLFLCFSARKSLRWLPAEIAVALS